MKITRNTMIRTIRTFVQAFVGSFITTGAGVLWFEVDLKEAIIATLMTSIFAGLSAVYMNLERGDDKNGNSEGHNKKSTKPKRK